MGGGRWDAHTYSTHTGSRISSGTTFGYDRSTHGRARSSWAAHPTLDPLNLVAGPASVHAGRNIRESRDSAEHPLTTPVCVFFDNTGSMGEVPRLLQENLTTLFALLAGQGYIPGPQMLIGAYGDAYVDRVPLQASQFESDNRVDEALNNLFLEGGGGGNDGESATLAWWFAAHHTSTDAWEKRHRKGFLFTIGDERALDITGSQLTTLLGTGEPAHVTAEQAAMQAQQRWHTYHLLVDNSTAKMQKSREQYEQLLGEDHVITLQDPAGAAAVIAAIIGVNSGKVTVDQVGEDIAAVAGRELATSTRAAIGAIGR